MYLSHDLRASMSAIENFQRLAGSSRRSSRRLRCSSFEMRKLNFSTTVPLCQRWCSKARMLLKRGERSQSFGNHVLGGGLADVVAAGVGGIDVRQGDPGRRLGPKPLDEPGKIHGAQMSRKGHTRARLWTGCVHNLGKLLILV